MPPPTAAMATKPASQSDSPPTSPEEDRSDAEGGTASGAVVAAPVGTGDGSSIGAVGWRATEVEAAPVPGNSVAAAVGVGNGEGKPPGVPLASGVAVGCGVGAGRWVRTAEGDGAGAGVAAGLGVAVGAGVGDPCGSGNENR
ncbi:hypothetical protein [Sphingomonas beigongshangi]|uniref:hypothetical protein n=1 Tax=Sphingomonas beigongshangi TaxID=2782540 RepID=UPI00193AFCA4|nr:hypothetical protein [Sphingomonas beigongshangi]